MSNEELIADGLLTIKEVMEFLAISRSQLDQLIRQGVFPTVTLVTARRIPRRAVVDYVMSRIDKKV